MQAVQPVVGSWSELVVPREVVVSSWLVVTLMGSHGLEEPLASCVPNGAGRLRQRAARG